MITAVVLTKNEAERISRCLQSLSSLSKVLIIDSYSEDRTLDIARDTWCSLGRSLEDLVCISRPWQGFTEARNHSLKWVTTPWVFWIDADEWLSPELKKYLETLPSDPAPGLARVYSLRRRSYFLGRPIYHGGWYPDYKARLAVTQDCQWRLGPLGTDVHEDLFPLSENSERVRLEFHIEHEPFRSVEEQKETNDRYSSLLAEGLAKKWLDRGRAPSLVYCRLKVAIKFIENYFWKLGFLDAYPGLQIALGSAQSMGWRLKKARRIFFERLKK